MLKRITRVTMGEIIAPAVKAHKQALSNSKAQLTRQRRKADRARTKAQLREEEAQWLARLNAENQRYIDTAAAECQHHVQALGDLRETLAGHEAVANNYGLDVRLRWTAQRKAKAIKSKMALVSRSLAEAKAELSFLIGDGPVR